MEFHGRQVVRYQSNLALVILLIIYVTNIKFKDLLKDLVLSVEIIIDK